MKVRLKDCTIEYQDRGEGAPLLLIHGYPLSRKQWDPQIDGLSGAARVIAPDLRGFGGSEAVAGDYTMEMLADDCHALLEGLDILQPVVVGGLSMGGYVTFAFYRKYPEWVAGLILAATRPGPDADPAKAKRDEAAALAQKGGSAAIAESMLPKMLSPKTYQNNPGLVGRVREIMESASVEGIRGALMGMKNRPDSTPLLEEIQKPVLVLHGADDQLIPPQEAEATHAKIKGSRLQILPDSGHLLCLEQPHLFNQAVREFLSTVES